MNELIVEIEKIRFIPPRWLYREDSMTILKDINTDTSIYTLSIANKVRFNVNSMKILSAKEIEVCIQVVGKKEFKLIIDCLNYNHVDVEPFDGEDGIHLSKDSNGYSISGVIKIYEKHKAFVIPIEHVVSSSKINFGLMHDVVYIGQSHGLTERLTKHEKLIQALSELDDEQELRINFLEFRVSMLSDNGVIDKESLRMYGNLKNNYLSKKSKKYREFINLIERSLIYYYKPKYNKNHIKTQLSKDKVVCQVLKKQNINIISLGLGMTGENWKYSSENVQNDRESIVYDLIRGC